MSELQVGRQVQIWALALARYQEGTGGHSAHTGTGWQVSPLAWLGSWQGDLTQTTGKVVPHPAPCHWEGEESPHQAQVLFQGLAVGLIGTALPKLTWNLRRAAG